MSNVSAGVVVGGMQVLPPSTTAWPPPQAPTELAYDPNVTSGECWDTYLDMQSEERSLFRFVLYGVVLTTVGTLGLLGNAISVTVLSRPKMRSSINCCLIGLSIFDMIVVSVSILMFGPTAIGMYTGTMFWYTHMVYPRITPFIYPLGMIAQTVSAYLTVTVTVERYVAVCLPLRARSLCTYGRAKIYVMAVVLFSILYNMSRFWEVSYQACEVPGLSFMIPVATSLRMNERYIQVYIMWMYLAFMYLVPFLSLMIFNTFIYREVRAANAARQQLSQLEKKEIGLAVMLLVVVMVFFVCNVLAFISNVLEILAINNSPITDHIIVASNVLVTINSSVNFIIYCIFGQKFRRLFLKMFCGRWLAASVLRRGTTLRDSNFYGDSRSHTNGRSTQIIRMSSWNGSQRRPEAPDKQSGAASHWRPFTKYSSVPQADDSTPRTASTSITPSRSPSLVPHPPTSPSKMPQTSEGDHAL